MPSPLYPHSRAELAPNYFNPVWAWELVQTLAVSYFLYRIALVLGTPGADLGLAARYGPLLQPWDAPFSAQWLKALYHTYLWGGMPQDLRAVALLRSAGYWLALQGVVGWLALQLLRAGTPWAAWLACAQWAALGWLLRPFQLPGMLWLGVCAAALVLALLTLPFWPWCHRASAATPHPMNYASASVWPGWVLLTGIGCLVVMDFAARGPVVHGGMAMHPAKTGARYFGLSQVDGLWLACAIVLASVYTRNRMLQAWVGLCNHLAALWQRPRGPLLLLLAALLGALALGWLGARVGRNYLGVPGWHGAGKPHISGEVLRLIVCALLAWFAYRVGEWPTSGLRVWRSMRMLVLLGLLCALGFVVSDDKGPLLILALALPLLVGLPLLQRMHGGLGPMLLGTLACVGLLYAWRTALVVWLPLWSTEAAKRAALFLDTFGAYSPNQAQVRWLLDATPSDGFGLARAPYCGAQAWVGNKACSLGSGAPLQTASDYAYVLLYASFGAWGAAASVAILLLWLYALTAGQLTAWRAGPNGSAQQARALLPVWLVAVPCLAAQAQTLVSVGAALGWSSLTGVTLPLLGYGSAALCSAALWVGLAAHSSAPPSAQVSRAHP